MHAFFLINFKPSKFKCIFKFLTSLPVMNVVVGYERYYRWTMFYHKFQEISSNYIFSKLSIIHLQINEVPSKQFTEEKCLGWRDKERTSLQFSRTEEAGENESYLSKLIRGDSVEDFIAYVNKMNISLNATIIPSIYETNSFLIKKQSQSDNGITLIESNQRQLSSSLMMR